MLDRATDRLCRCGAPVENLTHSASFHSLAKTAPSNPGIKHAALRARFDRIFTRRTGYVVLDRLHRRKAELLCVSQRPEIPLHNNGSENDIGVRVTKRKISGGTMSENGRTARDILLGLMKTCASSASRSTATPATGCAYQAPCRSCGYRILSVRPPPTPNKPDVPGNLSRLRAMPIKILILNIFPFMALARKLRRRGWLPMSVA
jgi:hypothetical protein